MLNHVNLMEKIVTLMEKIDTPTNYWREGCFILSECACLSGNRSRGIHLTHPTYIQFHKVLLRQPPEEYRPGTLFFAIILKVISVCSVHVVLCYVDEIDIITIG